MKEIRSRSLAWRTTSSFLFSFFPRRDDLGISTNAYFPAGASERTGIAIHYARYCSRCLSRFHARPRGGPRALKSAVSNVLSSRRRNDIVRVHVHVSSALCKRPASNDRFSLSIHVRTCMCAHTSLYRTTHFLRVGFQL